MSGKSINFDNKNIKSFIKIKKIAQNRGHWY